MRYLALGTGSSLFFTGSKVVLSLVGPAASAARPGRGLALELRFVGANRDTTIEAGDRAPGVSNHLVGDRSEWRRGLPRHRELTYRDLWPGIDLVFRGRGGRLEARVPRRSRGRRARHPALIRRRSMISGSAVTAVCSPSTALGTLTDARPYPSASPGWPASPGREPVCVERRAGSTPYGFAVGAGYDRGNPLVIDPGLDYSTFLGGAALRGRARGIAIDRHRECNVTGHHRLGGTIRPRLARSTPALGRLRRLRDQAGSLRLHAGVLDVSRRIPTRTLAWDPSRSTRREAPTSPANTRSM